MSRQTSKKVLLIDAFLFTEHHIGKIIAISKACDNLNISVILLTHNSLKKHYSKYFEKAAVISLPKLKRREVFFSLIISCLFSCFPRKTWKNIIYKHISFGRIAIDTVVRKSRGGLATYNMKRKRFRRALKYSFFRHFATLKLLKEYPGITDAVFFHKCYSLHGPIYQTLFFKNIRVIESFGDFFWRNKSIESVTEAFPRLTNTDLKNTPLKDAKNYFYSRLENLNDKDVKNAYLSKKVNSTWYKEFDMDHNKPSVLYAMHAFSDWNNSFKMFDSDYLESLKVFLEVIRKYKLDFNVFLKPHPTRNRYGEKDIWKSWNLEGFYIIPDTLRTDDVLEKIDIIVTPRGTISLEGVVRQKVVLNQAQSYFSDLNITHIAENAEQLELFFKNFKNEINSDAIDNAIKCMYLFQGSYKTGFDLFPAEEEFDINKREKTEIQMPFVKEQAILGLQKILTNEIDILNILEWKKIKVLQSS